MLKGKELWFRYGAQLPWVVQDRSRTVAPGQVVGLMAPAKPGLNHRILDLAGDPDKTAEISLERAL